MKRLKSNLSNPVIIAIDNLDRDTTLRYIHSLDKEKIFDNSVWGVKLAHPSINNQPMIMELQKLGVRVFSDPMLNLMKSVVGRHIASYTSADFISIHASGGLSMMREAVRNRCASRILAMTVKSDLSEEDCHEIFGAPIGVVVLRFARFAKLCGVCGFICPPRELRILSKYEEFAGMEKVSPAIRPKWWKKISSHQETMTPREAVESGATRLVIGDPIIEPIINYKKFIKPDKSGKSSELSEQEAWDAAILKSKKAIIKILDEIKDYLIDNHIDFIDKLNSKSKP